MKWMLRAVLVPLVALMASAAASAQTRGAPASDIVTLKNGDFHHGTVAIESLDLETSYGPVSLPFARLTSLRAVEGGLVKVETVEGERFTGRMVRDAFTMLRVIEAPLRIHGGDVEEIVFARRAVRPAVIPGSDVVEMQNGDIFRAHVASRDFMVMGENGLRLLSAGELQLVDLEPGRDGVRGRFQFNTPGRAAWGKLASGEVVAELRHGQAVALPPGEVATVAFGVLEAVRPHEGPLVAAYRVRVAPHALVRDRLRDGSSGPEMVVVRGGLFRRGDLQGDGDGDEQPSREVTLSRPFAIGLFEVTFEDYDRFCAATDCVPPDDDGWGRGRRPVINVSWEEATAYAAWLSEQTGQHYRLPTDAEWEYAARAGTESRFWWGDDPGTSRANCAGCGSLWDAERTARVGKFAPNAFGLHDTAGNVFEWVADCWHDTFAEAPSDGSAIDKEGCGKRVIRGGAWSFPPKEIRSANRWRDFPSRRSDDTGFRLVREMNF